MLFLKALAIGFCTASPIGPCGVLCISRSVRHGLTAGLATGIGVVLADMLYAAVGAFGVSFLIGWLEKWSGPLRICGALFLVLLGIKIAFTPPKTTESPAQGTFASSFLVTLANPLTIFAFLAIFAGLGISKEAGPLQSVVVVLGIGAGSLTWWLLLSWISAHFGKRLHASMVKRISQAAGWVIASLGLLALFAALRF